MKKIIDSAMNVSLMIGLSWACSVSAQQYFTNAGGSQTWDAVTANWAATSGGPYASVWTGGDAVFEGTAGSVNVDTVSADSLTFSIGGFFL